MKVGSSPRISPTSATERSDGMRCAYTSIGRPRTSSVVTSNMPPGPVSWARTSAEVGIAYPFVLVGVSANAGLTASMMASMRSSLARTACPE